MPRVQLFERLGGASTRSIVWIAAPPGSGKTTLASSYLAERAHLRIALDAHDADPASFFHTLRSRLARQAPRLGHALPASLPDDVRDPSVYARQFFRRLSESLEGPWALVLDDFQEIGQTTPLHAALAGIAEELPPGIQLWVLSRNEPSAPFARVRATGRLFTMAAAELRFSIAECRLLCAGSDVDADRLHALADGWAAGLALLLESGRLERRAPHRKTRGVVPEQWFFDYFATKVFDRLAAGERRLLLQVAPLPFIDDAMADAISRARAAVADRVADVAPSGGEPFARTRRARSRLRRATRARRA